MPRDTTGDNAGPVLIYYQAGITFSEAVDTERKDPSLSGKTINKGDISLCRKYTMTTFFKNITLLCYRQPNTYVFNKKWGGRCFTTLRFLPSGHEALSEATLTKDTLKLKRALKPPCPPSQDCFPPGLEWRSGASRAKQDESGIKSLCNLYAKGRLAGRPSS